MDRSTVARIEEWETRPTSDGYVGLAELAEDRFTGAVAAAGAHLLMANGKIVGVANGSIAAFEDAALDAHPAPDPALPLLFAMREAGGEVRGRYYTDDTPIEEVDGTLTDAGFTGYLELAENVLSGDYYVVYYGGRSLAVAFVGNKGRVVTGEEAFQLAADEVGIYEVTDVDLEVTDVPEPAAGASSGAAVADAEDVSAEAAAAEPAEPDAAEPDEPTEGREEIEVGIPDAEDDDAPGTADGTDDGSAADVEDAEAEPVEDAAEAAVDTADGGSASRPTRESTSTGGGGESAAAQSTEAPPAEPDERFEEEARWRETRTVPALDPEESTNPETEPATEPDSEPASTPTAQSAEPAEPPAEASTETGSASRVSQLEAALAESEEERERLAERLETAVEAREELEAERERLESRIAELESQLERARAAASSGDPSAGGSAGQAIDPETALDQTDLFVRYGSKSQPTLETAHDGKADAKGVAENLRIDSHSRFDAASATVDGRPFTEFLAGTIQYRFVAWLVEELLYEIRETGTEGKLRALYDVLPEIDRAEFNGTVASTDEEGETVSENFDVVCRNRMGKALIVANINDSLDPATGDMMGTLVEDTTEVAEAHESIGAAFLVTASFFQPDALETAAEATRGGGFLSRDSKKSFVNLSRNDGYHLCLVEARGEAFHVAVPEF